MNARALAVRLGSSAVISIVSFVICVSAPFFVGAQPAPSDLTSSLQELERCYASPAEMTSCGTRAVQTLMQGRNGGEVMNLLYENMPENMCHQFGHIVGREVFKKHGSLEPAIDECIYGCGGSCIHGTVEAALLGQLGIDFENRADSHADEDTIIERADELCQTATMCHGIGHMLFQMYNSFEKPLAICTDIATGVAREDCYWGVFMDHSMMYSTYNLILGDQKKQSYDLSDLLFPCNEVDEKYRHACYRYHPRLQAQMFDELDIQDRDERLRIQIDACETLGVQDRKSCFEGLGRTFVNTAVSTPEIPRTLSETFSSTTDKTAFTRGMIRSLVAHGYTSNSLSYCTELGGWFERFSCFYDSLITVLYVKLQ